MHHSPPPKPAVMLSLAVLAVELPFLIVCLLVQWLKQCPHCRHEWLSWPILAGAFPSYFVFSHNLNMLQVRLGWGAFTACLIALIFVASWRSALWRQLLAGGLAVSSGLAILAYLLIAA